MTTSNAIQERTGPMTRDSFGDAGSPAPDSDARGRAVMAELRSLFEDAAFDAAMSHRLARADTSVRFTMEGDEHASITVLLDREPIELVLDGDRHSPEVELIAPWQVLDRLFDEDYHLTMAVIRHEVAFRGPVRKLLLVMPILQHFADAKRSAEAAADEVVADTFSPLARRTA